MRCRRLAGPSAVLLAVGLGVLAVVLSAGDEDAAPRVGNEGIGLLDVLSGPPEGFARAIRPRPLVFPRDHGPHPRFRSEWWYFTGHLRGANGRRFGFQLTFFRFALDVTGAPRDSAWATRQIYMAHFALTDVQARRFRSFERLSRANLAMAGAQAAPFRVWLEDWSAGGGLAEGQTARLEAHREDVGLELTLEPGKTPVLHGDRGLSQKSAEPGNASHYYSLTRMPARGSVWSAGERVAVEGEAWLDREWGTSALAPDQVGWDWFGLQLSDGRELMYYQLRRADGGVHPFSAGTLVEVNGRAISLASQDVQLQVLDRWLSPDQAVRYPSKWRLLVSAHSLDVEVEALLADQELRHALRYWEGAAKVTGTANGQPVSGYGYVELTGYDRPGRGALN